MPVSFTLNGQSVTVDTDDDVGLLYVLRDLLGEPPELLFSLRASLSISFHTI